MASILFVDYQTVIPASWLNDVNAMVYSGTVPAPTLTVNNLVVNTSVSGTGVTSLFASPPSIGNGAPGTGAFTTLSASGAITLSGGTANGVAYLNGSKVLTTGSALTFDGSYLALTNSGNIARFGDGTNTFDIRFRGANNWSIQYAPSTDEWALKRNSINQYSANGASHIWSFPAGEQMRLTSTGLGIGTSSPSAKLDVSYTASAGNIAHFAGANNVNGYIGAHALNNGGLYINSNQPNQDLRLQTQGTDRVILDSSGNLGLGVTPSAWDTVTVFQNKYTSFASLTDAAFYTANGSYTNAGGWKYQTNNYSSQYRQISGQHAWYTAPSGTAGNAISFTQAMTLDASGNLGLGVTNPQLRLDVSGSAYFRGGSRIYLQSADTTNEGYWYNPGSGSNLGQVAWVQGGYGERMRIDSSGNVLVGTTSTLGGGGNDGKTGVQLIPSNSASLIIQNSTDSTLYLAKVSGYTSGYFAFMYVNGTSVGSISTNGTTTSFTTTSDHRLKENIQPMQNALDVVAQLNPVTYNWKADGSDGQGFIAHELQAVVPDCVTGEKDAVDAEGKPVYQGIDTSFLVATLAAAIQELKAELDATKAEVAALKGN